MVTQPALLHTPRTVPLLPGFPPQLAGQTVAVEVPRAVRLRLRTPTPIRVSECAEQFRYVTGVDAEPGPWRNSTVPHAVKAMDVCGLPWVREAWICGVERSAKTQVLLNYAQHAVKYRPGNIFWLEPAEEDAGKNIKTKIIPMFREAAAKTRYGNYLSDRADDTGKGLISFRHGIHLFPAHSNSARSMSNFFGMHNLANEVDKYPPTTGPETDPINLLYKRGRDARNPKFIFASTPAGRFIYKGMRKCRQIWTWGLRCPHCREVIVPDDDHLVIPDGATAEDVKNGTADVGYSCNACGVVWSEHDRQSAYQDGADVCLKGADVDRAATVGFHWPSLNIGKVPLSETAEKYLLSKTGDHAAKLDYSHGYKCVDFKEELSDRKEDAILLLRDDRLEGELPAQPFSCITAVADMQKRGFWYSIRAWGYGLELESWLLKAGFVDSWEALRKLFFESEFLDGSGQKHHITLRGMDSGGGEGEGDLSKTAEAILFCYQNPGILPFKGQQRMSSLTRSVPQDKIPGTNKALPGGLKLYHLNATELKNRLAAKLLVAPGDPGAWHLHSQVDPEFARQMCAEGKDKDGHWQNPKNRPNHFWDCSYMELGLVEIAQVKLWPRPDAAATHQPPPRRVYSEGVVR